MEKINFRRALVGGMIAGVVLSAIDVLAYGALLKAPTAAAWQAAGRPTMSDALRSIEVPASIFLDFVAGIFLVWLYAAIRPRFGTGCSATIGSNFDARRAGHMPNTTPTAIAKPMVSIRMCRMRGNLCGMHTLRRETEQDARKAQTM